MEGERCIEMGLIFDFFIRLLEYPAKVGLRISTGSRGGHDKGSKDIKDNSSFFRVSVFPESFYALPSVTPARVFSIKFSLVTTHEQDDFALQRIKSEIIGF